MTDSQGEELYNYLCCRSYHIIICILCNEKFEKCLRDESFIIRWRAGTFSGNGSDFFLVIY